MADPFFFGYGSLVNRGTHSYADAHRARIKGWRRAWAYTTYRPRPFLTAIRCAESEIEGLVARVPGADWVALDEREAGYERLPIDQGLWVENDPKLDAQIYAVKPENICPATQEVPLLLSYIDVVVQGYLHEFGEEGAVRFFETTDGWDAPIHDDRANPIYPRDQVLSENEQAFVDHHLARLKVRFVDG